VATALKSKLAEVVESAVVIQKTPKQQTQEHSELVSDQNGSGGGFEEQACSGLWRRPPEESRLAITRTATATKAYQWPSIAGFIF